MQGTISAIFQGYILQSLVIISQIMKIWCHIEYDVVRNQYGPFWVHYGEIPIYILGKQNLVLVFNHITICKMSAET